MKKTATLIIHCPDRKGIVASVADFLYKNNANIIHADEHQDSERHLFFLRIEWEMNDFVLDKDAFKQAFSPIAAKFNMHWEVFYPEDILRIAIFVSRQDHCLADLLYRYKSGELACTIPVIISNHPDAREYADFSKIPFHEILATNNKKQAEEQVLSILNEQRIDAVVLARYMQVLSKNFLTTFGRPIINIHHSFLPAFVGAKPYHQAYERGVKIIGATAHFVTPDLDQGPIIAQDILQISHRDTVADLIQKGKDIEKIVLSRAVKMFIEHRILTYENKTVVFD